MTRLPWVLVVLLGACGDDAVAVDASVSIDAPRADAPRDAAIDAPITRRCGAAGTGTTSGTILGAQITPVMRAYQVTTTGQGTAIVIDETAATGCTAATTGEHLAILICDLPSVRTYPVVGEQAFACPSTDSFGLIEQNGGSDFAESTGGSVVVTDVSGGCTTGTFSINYLNETLTGTFDAFVCP